MTKDLRDGSRWTDQRARLKQAYRSTHPVLEPEHWYQVVDPEELGFYLEVSGALRFVSWEHFEIRAS